MHSVGTRAEVMHGTAHKTSGGLTRCKLYKNKHGRIVSRKKHETAKKEKRLEKHGFSAKKGKFGMIRIAPKSGGGKSRRHRKLRGGKGAELTPGAYGSGDNGDWDPNALSNGSGSAAEVPDANTRAPEPQGGGGRHRGKSHRRHGTRKHRR